MASVPTLPGITSQMIPTKRINTHVLIRRSEDVYPAQPMVSQMRDILERYAANGGRYQEVVIPDAGHSGHIEKPETFNAALHAFLEA